MKQQDIIIIGGGIIGVSTAYFLAQQGHSITLIEKGEIAAGSSYGNAGLLCPCHSVPLPTPGALTQGIKWLLDAASPFYIKPRFDRDLLAWLWRFQSFATQKHVHKAIPLLRDMQRASQKLYQELIEQENLACNFEKLGGLTLFRTEAGFAHGRSEVAEVQRFGIQVVLLDGTAVRALEPTVHPDVVGGIHMQEDAHLTPHLFVNGLAQAAQAKGVIILTQTEVLTFEAQNGYIETIRTTKGDFHPQQVVISAGAWSSKMVKQLGMRVLMQPAKGYSVTVKRPLPSPRLHLSFGEARVVATPMGEHLRFAGTLELAGFDFSINQRRVNAILNAVDQYIVGADQKEVVEIWRGMRPCSPDGLPYIGRSQQVHNLIVATGHATLGLSMGPITGKLVAQVVGGKRPLLNIDAFRLNRFS